MILLTGASGFIGSHLLNALTEKYGVDNVIALTSKPIKNCSYVLHNDYVFEDDYLIKQGVAKSIKTIIHAGAFIPKSSADANNWEQCNKNVYNTEKLLKASLPSLEKIVYLSTVDVYGSADIISEETNVAPVSLYGFSKLYGEKMIESWAAKENKAVQVLRVGHVYGPGEEEYQKILPVLIRKILKNEPAQIWGEGLELRSFIFIKDLISAILASIDLTENIGVINLVGGSVITIKDLVSRTIEISGKNISTEKVPTNSSGRNLVFNNQKMKKYLLATETDLTAGLTEEWLYMKKKYE